MLTISHPTKYACAPALLFIRQLGSPRWHVIQCSCQQKVFHMLFFFFLKPLFFFILKVFERAVQIFINLIQSRRLSGLNPN